MQIQINTDHNLKASQDLTDSVSALLNDKLKRFTSNITTIVVHLSDENAGKGGANDKKCALEVRLEGRPPTVVTSYAGTHHDALEGAIAKMKSSLDHTIGRLHDNKIKGQ